MRTIPRKDWRGLQKAFRVADGSARSGELDMRIFASVLSKYNVVLTSGEMEYASTVSGGGTGKGECGPRSKRNGAYQGRGPKIVEIETLASRSAKRKSKVVKYVDFLRRFVDSKVLLDSLKKRK